MKTFNNRKYATERVIALLETKQNRRHRHRDYDALAQLFDVTEPEPDEPPFEAEMNEFGIPQAILMMENWCDPALFFDDNKTGNYPALRAFLDVVPENTDLSPAIERILTRYLNELLVPMLAQDQTAKTTIEKVAHALQSKTITQQMVDEIEPTIYKNRHSITWDHEDTNIESALIAAQYVASYASRNVITSPEQQKIPEHQSIEGILIHVTSAMYDSSTGTNNSIALQAMQSICREEIARCA